MSTLGKMIAYNHHYLFVTIFGQSHYKIHRDHSTYMCLDQQWLKFPQRFHSSPLCLQCVLQTTIKFYNMHGFIQVHKIECLSLLYSLLKFERPIVDDEFNSFKILYFKTNFFTRNMCSLQVYLYWFLLYPLSGLDLLEPFRWVDIN